MLKKIPRCMASNQIRYVSVSIKNAKGKTMLICCPLSLLFFLYHVATAMFVSSVSVVVEFVMPVKLTVQGVTTYTCNIGECSRNCFQIISPRTSQLELIPTVASCCCCCF